MFYLPEVSSRIRQGVVSILLYLMNRAMICNEPQGITATALLVDFL